LLFFRRNSLPLNGNRVNGRRSAAQCDFVDVACTVDVLQRQRVDADSDADNGRSDAGAGADPCRGSRHEGRLQHSRDARTSQPLSHRSDAALRRHSLAVRGTVPPMLDNSLYTIKTRSTGTVHTSAKARLTSVADRHQNLIICSPVHCQPSLKISCKSVWKFLCRVANRQTDRQTDKQRRLHILLGGGNKNVK